MASNSNMNRLSEVSKSAVDGKHQLDMSIKVAESRYKKAMEEKKRVGKSLWKDFQTENLAVQAREHDASWEKWATEDVGGPMVLANLLLSEEYQPRLKQSSVSCSGRIIDSGVWNIALLSYHFACVGPDSHAPSHQGRGRRFECVSWVSIPLGKPC